MGEQPPAPVMGRGARSPDYMGVICSFLEFVVPALHTWAGFLHVWMLCLVFIAQSAMYGEACGLNGGTQLSGEGWGCR